MKLGVINSTVREAHLLHVANVGDVGQHFINELLRQQDLHKSHKTPSAQHQLYIQTDQVSSTFQDTHTVLS